MTSYSSVALSKFLNVISSPANKEDNYLVKKLRLCSLWVKKPCRHKDWFKPYSGCFSERSRSWSSSTVNPALSEPDSAPDRLCCELPGIKMHEWDVTKLSKCCWVMPLSDFQTVISSSRPLCTLRAWGQINPATGREAQTELRGPSF